tara:strand:- start:1296 stop:2198 length:903 start_codon:yes stop_codon:yes gene_type:complete
MISCNTLVSVILPVYNAEKYVVEAVMSICNQTYSNLELIIIDDGSTDNSKELIESIPDKRIRFISRENRGLISTLNEGVRLSSGEYIARMDADDICSVDRIEKQVKHLELNPKIGVLFTSIHYIDAEGSIFRSKLSKRDRLLEPVELIFGCPLCHPTAMFNLKTLTKGDISYDDDYRKAEDFELWTRLITKTKIGLLSASLLKYRIHSESITSNNNSEQRRVAIQALINNLLMMKTNRIINSISTIYNNNEEDSLCSTLWAALFIALNLSRLNKTFSRVKYSTRLYYLIASKLRPNASLR